MTRPCLDGVSVLDFATVGPAARCTRILADYGATVVKIGAPPKRSGVQIEPAFYAYAGGRGTKRVRLDLKAPAGKAAFLRLAERADVGLRPGGPRIGLGGPRPQLPGAGRLPRVEHAGRRRRATAPGRDDRGRG